MGFKGQGSRGCALIACDWNRLPVCLQCWVISKQYPVSPQPGAVLIDRGYSVILL